MFEVGFSELCMVALVALLVIGPERLPKVARLAGFWLGKTRRMIETVKTELKVELQAEEMRQIFKEQMALEELQKMQSEFTDIAHTIAAPPKSPENSIKPRNLDEQD
jgi:sec-independent protein translocase protein TatB